MDDYYKAAERIFRDAQILFSSKRWFGTCYLAGYVVECYCKLIIKLHNPSIDLKDYNHNLNRLNRDIKQIMNLTPITKYIIDARIECPRILTGSEQWHPTKRYIFNINLWNSEQISKTYLAEARKVMNKLIQMKNDRVI